MRAVAAEHGGGHGPTLAQWAKRAREAMVAAGFAPPESAADLVIEDRRRHL
ncbi:MAG: hypothetical protein ACYCUD_12595 [Candidatus Dormibacteria bacterium]